MGNRLDGKGVAAEGGDALPGIFIWDGIEDVLYCHASGELSWLDFYPQNAGKCVNERMALHFENTGKRAVGTLYP